MNNHRVISEVIEFEDGSRITILVDTPADVPNGQSTAAYYRYIAGPFLERVEISAPTTPACPHCHGPLTKPDANEWLTCHNCGGRYGA